MYLIFLGTLALLLGLLAVGCLPGGKRSVMTRADPCQAQPDLLYENSDYPRARSWRAKTQKIFAAREPCRVGYSPLLAYLLAR